MTKTTQETISNQGLSVIIPTFNGAPWLPKTISKVTQSLQEAKIDNYEIVLVDDGSTDNSVQVVEDYAREHSLPLRVVSQKNGGRFVARRTGGEVAKFENLLFIDTRVFIGKESLSYLLKQHKKDPTRNVWCSHVRVDTKGNIYARFWEAIAYVAWRKYFSNPRDIAYGIDEFDTYPKGTTCFFIKKEILSEANEWFVKNTKDLKTSNDDTLLIRHIAEDHSINISPNFWCLYHARSALRPYVKHVFHRGKVFVDGFLRRDGNVFFWPLVGFLLASVLVPVAITAYPSLLLPVLTAGVVAWLLELLLIVALRVPIKDGLSLFVLSPIFAVFYAAGIWQAVINIYGFKRVAR